MKPVKCQQCGNKFVPRRSTGVYCSTRCRVSSHRESVKVAAEHIAWMEDPGVIALKAMNDKYTKMIVGLILCAEINNAVERHARLDELIKGNDCLPCGIRTIADWKKSEPKRVSKSRVYDPNSEPRY